MLCRWVVCSFLSLRSSPRHECTTVSITIHLLIDILVVSSIWKHCFLLPTFLWVTRTLFGIPFWFICGVFSLAFHMAFYSVCKNTTGNRYIFQKGNIILRNNKRSGRSVYVINLFNIQTLYISNSCPISPTIFSFLVSLCPSLLEKIIWWGPQVFIFKHFCLQILSSRIKVRKIREILSSTKGIIFQISIINIWTNKF